MIQLPRQNKQVARNKLLATGARDETVIAMANFHCTAQMISRQGGKSCVAALAYRSATELVDQRTGEVWNYTNKANVGHVEILLPNNAPSWISELAHECRTDRQSALQKFSDIIEASEKRKDSQVYREVEFSLPNELTKEQNIEWANAFVKDILVARGMVSVVSFHFDIDPKTGMQKPHCHVLLSTRHLTEDGFGLKNREWNRKDLIEEARDQCCQYQNAALKEHGYDVRVTNLSYADREVDIDPQPKLGANVREMSRNGIETDKRQIFDLVRLKNQFKIVKNPEIVFDIVTSKHATFTRKDIAKILNRYIDDAGQFQILLDRLMNSKELVSLQPKPEEKAGKGVLEEPGIEGEKEQQKQELGQASEKGQEPVYTTRKMVRAELNLIKTAEALATRTTHPVSVRITNRVVAKYHRKFKKDGGLSADQETAIRHMLSGEQISCVVGFAGAGKTTCLEAVNEAWEEAGYSVLGLAPTGKAERSIAACGIRSMTAHRFLRSQELGRERISRKTIVVVDEAGMLDSRRFSELQAIVAKAGAKIVPMGDGNQTQAVEAGPPFRLITDRIAPAVLETIVRQQIDWQREASRFFGTLQPRKALKLYQENGCFYGIQEKMPDITDEAKTIDNYCLARQISGRIWKEMIEDVRTKNEKEGTNNKGSANQDVDRESTVDRWSNLDFEAISQHQDYATHTHWKNMRLHFVQSIIHDFDTHKAGLVARAVDVKAFGKLVTAYKATESGRGTPDTGVPDTGAEGNRKIIFERIENALRKMSYENIVDTRVNARQALVEAWAVDRKAYLNQSHLMLAFTKEDAHKLNEAARVLMREQGAIKGTDFTYKTQIIEEDDFGVEYRECHDRTFAKGDRILFTRNDKGLGVSNGTLGTILSLRQGKIKVALDGEGNQTVSFSPRLYPFFDNGWGTTIRKAQSVTLDHVKFLGSWQDYRNMAYVALTRHRHSLKLFFSDLDFWRPEKLSDRLSRIQEKLAGLDYLDAEKLQEQLKEDTQILWRHWHLKKIEDGIQQGKDLWTAIKVTAQDVFETIIPPKEAEHKEQARLEQARLGEEAFQSLDDSEEMRSRNFFNNSESEVEDLSSVHDQFPVDGRSQGSKTSQKGQRRSASRSQKKQEGNHDGKRENSPSSPDSTTPNQQNTAHAGQQAQEASRQQENNKGFACKDQEPRVRDQDKQQQEENEDKHFPRSSPARSLDSSQPSSNSSMENDEFKKKLEALKEKIKSDYETKIVIREKPLSFEEVDKQLKERIYELATSIFGEPNKGSRNSAYLRFGELGEFSVGFRGKHQGIYTNFVTGVKGGPLKLIEDQMGLSSSKEALTKAREWLGGHGGVVEHQTVRKVGKEHQEAPKLEWKPIVPVPNTVKDPDLTGKYLNYMLKDGWQETGRYAYRDATGNLKGYVIRLEKERGEGKKNDKKPLPLAWCENEKLGITCWKSQAFDNEDKTPYGIEKLAQDLSKPVLVVEGEKTVDAAQKRLSGYHVLSWIGGAGNVGLTNWEPLVGKTVVMWPDNDEAGHKAAQEFQKVIGQLGAKKNSEIKVGIIQLPKELSEGWDLGDPLPKEWTDDTVLQMIQEVTPVREEILAQAEALPSDESVNVHDVGSKAETYAPTVSPFPSSDASLRRGDFEESPSEKTLAVKSPRKLNALDHKQEKFEKSRLSFHQEWSAQLGFFVQHRRFPNKGKEIAFAWWQGERLTAIEGRLYREALERKEEPDDKQLTLDARTELAKNQKAPSHIMTLGKASDLDKAQLKQFEQHVLTHQDKTGQLPTPSDLDLLCQAIKVLSQIIEADGIENRANNQGTTATKTPEPTSGEQKTSEKTPAPDIYRTLIEQQAVLACIKEGGLNSLARNEMSKDMVAALQSHEVLQAHDIRDSCLERLDRLDAKIQSVKELSQDMKNLDRNRQNQRGIEM